ncbi:toll-like receptor 3 [Branchiostoma lanceolatum]|uniref:toll-like receptor 3 n=1 Tax=Branchiostoma lanceolatum TaxID=7740 RepID=UPI003452EDD7
MATEGDISGNSVRLFGLRMFLTLNTVLALSTRTQGHTWKFYFSFISGTPCTIVNKTATCSNGGLTQIPSNLPHNLINLDLSNNDIQAIRNSSLSSLHFLEVLNIGRNKLSVIEPAAFYNLSSLKTLLLKENRLSYLPPGLFAPLSTLQYLYLSDNSLQNILQADVWKGLNLKKLDVSYNQIISGTFRSDFAATTSLRELVLSGNDISSLNYSDFQPFLLNEFDLLDFSYNPITHIDKDFFTLFSAIKTLDLSNILISFSNLQAALEGLNDCNKISLDSYTGLPVISYGSFACLQNTSLKSLKLSRAEIQEIQDNSFYGLTHLENLGLQWNLLTELSGLVFHGLSSLQVLDLSFVSLTHIPTAALSEVSHTLRELTIFSTEMKTIHKDDFNNLPNLKVLYLNADFSGGLEEIEPFGFRGLQNLEVLQLDDNDLTHLVENTFAGLNNLTKLSLKRCNIKRLSGRIFANLTSLVELDLSVNNLVHLPKMLFSDLISLEVLIINNNYNLFPYFESIDFTGLASIKHIDLSHDGLFLDNQTLNFPANTRLETLDLSYNQLFVASLPNSAFEKLRYLTELNLSGNKLAKIPAYGAIFHGLSSLIKLIMKETGEIWSSFSNDTILYGMPNLEVIDLSASSISYIPAELFKVHDNLRSVDLSSNKITYLPQTLFSANSKLQSLFLSWNSITLLNESTFETILPGLEKLAIHDNPFFCDCEIEWFISWADDHPSVVQGWSDGRYQCNTPPRLHGTDLPNFHPDCASHRDLYACAITTSFLLLYMLFAVLVNFCRGHFAYMWFRVRLRLRGYEEIREQPQQFRYDAFVAYSSNDEAWVARVLSPMLERSPPRYRLCIGERDFVGGVPILHNISNAVEMSRKTVCIITRSFLRSNWCNYELQMSQGRHHLFDPRRVSLVLVFLENVPDRVLERYPLLNNIVNRDTYLRWPNNQQHLPLFWARLRQALGPPLWDDLQEVEDIEEDVV